ncbi:MAG: hypothetical protein HY876_04510 [Coriobacteriales bacterium]|nr:hypothetical protein [Coriobacteriales bacterium]
MATSRARVEETVRRHEAAQARLDAIEARVAKNSARLDRLVERQALLQDRLRSRATRMYRKGPLDFLEVLAKSTTFDEFASTWDLLARIGRHEAVIVRELKSTRARVAKTARELMKQQGEASAQLREVRSADARARRDLEANQALLANYEERITDLEAKQKKAVVRPKAAGRPSVPKGSSAKGSGAWSTAVASCYGDALIGSRMANGDVVRADSMIVAHKTLPFGTLVEFSYNGRTAVAEVTDRGPFIAGREFDLGPGITRVLGFDGVQTVRYRIIGG